MTYGARFENDLGLLVISDERLIETFIGKAAYSSTAPNRMGRVFRYYIASSLRPMVFLHSLNYCSVLSIVRSGSGWLIEVVTNGSAGSITVYCFASKAQAGYDSGYGMNIYDPSGNVVFSSNWKILNVRGISQPPQNGGSSSHGVSGLVKPASMCPCNSGVSAITSSGTSYAEWDDRDVFLVTQSSITTARVRIHVYTDSYSGYGSDPYDYGDRQSVNNVSASPFPIIDAAQYD